MTEPQPRELERRLGQIEHLVAEIRDQYRWTHGWANNRSRSGEGGKVTKGDVNDETGTIVVAKDKEMARRAMTHANETVNEALSALRSAAFTLSHAIPDREPVPTALEPSFLTRAEKAQSHEAKQRREINGQGWGSG